MTEKPTDPELNEALMLLARRSQEVFFEDELECLKHKEEVRKRSPLSQLTPFLDERGLIRSNGRLDFTADDSFAAKPIIIHYKSDFAYRYVKDLHVRMDHKGTTHLLYLVRKNFWILRAKNVVQNVVKKCFLCRKRRGELYQQQLGKVRPESTPKIEKTGKPALHLWASIAIDTIGPYSFKDINDDTKKCHVLVIVDMISRYVRLMMLDHLTARSLFVALQTHAAITRKPDKVLCDCFSSFAVIDKFNIEVGNELRAELKNMLGKDGVAMELVQHDEATEDDGVHLSIKHESVFSPPHSHHSRYSCELAQAKENAGPRTSQDNLCDLQGTPSNQHHPY